MRFLRAYLEAAWSSSPADAICALMQRRARLRPFVLSFEAVAVYLNALSAAHDFCRYFAFLIEAEHKLAACATPNVVQLFYPLGLRRLGAFLAGPLTDPKAPWDTAAMRSAVSAIVFVVAHSAEQAVVLSDATLQVFRKALADIEPALETALRSLAKVPDPVLLQKGVSARAQAAVFVPFLFLFHGCFCGCFHTFFSLCFFSFPHCLWMLLHNRKAKQILAATEDAAGGAQDGVLAPIKAQLSGVQRVLTHFANKK